MSLIFFSIHKVVKKPKILQKLLFFFGVFYAVDIKGSNTYICEALFSS
jgi:hypothetical protein